MINYTLRRKQEPNDSKDWKTIQFFYQEIVHKKDKELWKNHVDFLILAYHWELKWQVYGFQQKYVYYAIQYPMTGSPYSLRCFAGLDLQAVYLRNPELLISINRWQEYIKSLHVFRTDIMRTLELHAYIIYTYLTISFQSKVEK